MGQGGVHLFYQGWILGGDNHPHELPAVKGHSRADTGAMMLELIKLSPRSSRLSSLQATFVTGTRVGRFGEVFPSQPQCKDTGRWKACGEVKMSVNIATKRGWRWLAVSAAFLIVAVIASAASPSLFAQQLPSPTVIISDGAFNPPIVNVSLGGSVTWLNQGTKVHTVTSIPGQNPAFDSGGLAPTNSFRFVFSRPGIFQYMSTVDCVNGNSNAAFACGSVFTVNVIGPGTPVPSLAAAAFIGFVQPTAVVPTPTPQPTEVPAPLGPTGQPLVITIDDTNGFLPATLSVNPGQTVKFVNVGPSSVHTVVSDGGISPSFDSGGMSPGMQWYRTFDVPGSVTFHSSTEPQYLTAQDGTPYVGFQFTGTIMVLTPGGQVPTPTPSN
jgi:plastocyanin